MCESWRAEKQEAPAGGEGFEVRAAGIDYRFPAKAVMRISNDR